MMEYKYLGDRFTDTKYKNATCLAVRNKAGKCIRGRNGNMLVEFTAGGRAVIIARLLRKLKPPTIK